MSLFKRKQSKEKDTPVASTVADAVVNSPPVAAVAQMASVRPGGQSPYGSGIVGRRMTSNPMPMGTAPMNGHPGSLSTASLPPPFPANAHPQDARSANGIKSPQQPYAPGGPGQQQSPAGHQRQSSVPTPTYPWSTRPLRLYAPQTNPPSAPLSPFPRYGLSVPAFPSHSGHILIFGGLVEDSVKNDLWSMDVRDCTTMPVKTKGDAPLPRVGHASAMADRIMLVWGGDTKVQADDPQDETLYILDLRTQEWTRLPVARGPVGRYGHAACMFESRFYVFGGQAEAEYMNDLWAYDIKQLSSDAPQRWELVQYTTPAPPRRTGHVLTSHQGKLYLFGGTDGSYHYNDTWSFDLATGAWTELSCIGYIPVPREGHAAAVVDDVMYIFGGRDVNGKDLGDLAAFRITNQRWYMFQNMGLVPTARSGHAMVAAHGKIFVVGGEANASSPLVRDDPNVIHVLDTGKIKYPADSEPPRQLKARASDAALQQQHQQQQLQQQRLVQQQPPQAPFQQPPLQAQQAQQYPTQQSPQQGLPGGAPRSAETTPRLPNSGSGDNLARAASPPNFSDRQLHQTPQLSQQQSPLTNQQSPLPILAAPVPVNSPRSEGHEVPPVRAGPPQRPRREGDEEYRRAMSPQNAGASPTHPGVRVTSPNGYSAASPAAARSANSGVLGTRSPSPRQRDPERPAPPPDAFYYGRSPTSNGFNPSRNSISGSADLVREIKAKDTEIELGKKREAALRAIIGKATAAGFVLDDDDADAVEGDANVEGDSATVRKLVDALVRLKHEKAAIANDLAAQVQIASDRAAESDRLRRGALQEAAFFRAKAATLESNSPVDLNRIEKERINELERQLGSLHAEHATVQRDFERHKGESLNARDLHSTALQREQETLKRAEDAEEAHRLAVEEMEELQQRLQVAESGMREHAERAVTLSSTSQQREAERDRLRTQLDEALATHDQHVSIIGQVQTSLATHGTRAAELERLHETAKERVAELEKELAQARFELESAQREAQAVTERLAEAESAHTRTREEAESLRGVTTSQLGQLVETHRALREDTTRGQRENEAQVRALEEEANALRKMLREAGQRLDAAESGVHTHRQKTRELESAHHSLRSELRSHQTKLITAQQELTRHRDLHSTREAELRGRDETVTELETRCATLRNLLAEHGIAVSDDDLGHKAAVANGSVPASREMETLLRDKTRAHDDARREIAELTLRCTEAENRAESLTRLMEQVKGARSPTMSMRSPSPGGESDRRVIEAERKIQEMETVHKEKMAALEGDYQTAVRYVKGTEKMLKRMKDELNKQKAANTALQTEMDGITGRSSAEPGARTREVASGRATPSSYEPELTRRNEKLQGQLSALQAELSASRGVLQAREREVEVLRMRVEESDREAEILRDDLAQSQHRINTLLGTAGYGLGSDEDRRLSLASSVGDDEDEATMSYDKFSKELKQWERSRSPESVKVADEATPRHAKAAV